MKEQTLSIEKLIAVLDLNAFGVDIEGVDTAVRPQDWDFQAQAVKAQTGCQLTRTPQNLIWPLILCVTLISLGRRRISH
mgnify:CR=1 FL=1